MNETHKFEFNKVKNCSKGRNFDILCVLGSRGIKCYNCETIGSSCHEGVRTCPAPYNLCLKVVIQNDGQTGVAESCGNSEVCSVAKTRCKNYQHCDVTCCSSDYCNASPRIASPKVLMVIVGALLFSLWAGFWWTIEINNHLF